MTHVRAVQMCWCMSVVEWLFVVDAEENTERWCCGGWAADARCWQIPPSVCSVVSSSGVICLWHASINECGRVFLLLWLSHHKTPACCFLLSARAVCLSHAVVVRSEEKEAWFVACTSFSTMLNVFYSSWVSGIRNGILLQQSPKIPRRHLGYSTLQWLDLYIVTPSGALVTDHFSPPSLSWAAASIFLQLFSNCAVPISDYTALLQVFHCCRVLRVAVSVGSRAFPAAASSVWNSLPDNVASASTLDFSTRP